MSRAPLPLLLLFVASAALAQNTPPPPTPYPAPIVAYDGRYVDSAQTPNFQFPNRTIRTYKAKAAPELNLMLVSLSGSTFAAYDLTTLPGRLAAPARATGAHGEKYLAPDLIYDAQAPGSGFQIVLMDGQVFLRDFDYDDRGDFYLAYSAWGFGLIDRNAQLLSQVAAPPVFPLVILSVRSGASYYALVSDGTTATAVYDVTNAASPAFVRMLPFPISAYAKSSTAIAVVTGGSLRFYTPAALVAGSAPLQEIVPLFGRSFSSVTSDGSRFYAIFFNVVNFVVATLTPQGGSYVETDTPLGGAGFPQSIAYGAGYLGVPTIAPKGLFVFATGDSGLTPYNLSAYVNAAYPSFVIVPDFAVPFSSGASTHLLLAFEGIGDVFQLAATTPIPAVGPLALALVALALAMVAFVKLR